MVTVFLLLVQTLRRVAFSEDDLAIEHYYPKYDYSDYEDIQNDEVTTGFSFSFWKSKIEVDGADEQNGLSQRLHPSLRSPETDPDSYRYSPSRDATKPGHTPSKPSSSVTTTITLHNYKPSILSSYNEGAGMGVGDTTLQQNYTTAMENGLTDEGGEGEDYIDDGSQLMSADAAAMLW